MLGLVGYGGLPVSGDLPATGRLGVRLHHKSSSVLRSRVLPWLLSCMCGRSGVCAGVVGVDFRVGFGRCRSVMRCGVVRHRSGRCVGVWASVLFFVCVWADAVWG